MKYKKGDVFRTVSVYISQYSHFLLLIDIDCDVYRFLGTNGNIFVIEAKQIERGRIVRLVPELCNRLSRTVLFEKWRCSLIGKIPGLQPGRCEFESHRRHHTIIFEE